MVSQWTNYYGCSGSIRDDFVPASTPIPVLPLTALRCWCYKLCYHAWVLWWVLGIQTQGFTFVQQAYKRLTNWPIYPDLEILKKRKGGGRPVGGRRGGGERAEGGEPEEVGGQGRSRREEVKEGEPSVTSRRSTGTQGKRALLKINNVNCQKKELVNLKKDW